MNRIDTMHEQAHSLLKKFYGYNAFRSGQLEIISHVASGGDALVLMPTGGGKSICYQLPALMADGCAVVVSPLIALMEDQTAALVANGIPAAAIHSGRPEMDNRLAIDAAISGRMKLLYVSPERLVSDLDIWVKRLPISLFAIDEAHCISQWGHDFRPVYTQLSVIKQQFPTVPLMALTATADRLTRDDISTQLGLRNPLRWTGSFSRPNLSLEVVRGATKKQRVAAAAQLVRRFPNDSGIVYTLSRAGAEEMDASLRALGLRSAVYHAGMSARDRAEAQRAFSDGRVQAICATVAFGMGIDKSNIRWVLHTNLPANIESYYQEIGRAGRDGLPAVTVLHYSLSDMITRRKFIELSGQPQVASEKLRQMLQYAQAQVCRRRVLLSYFGEASDHDCGNCDVCRNPPERFDGTVLVQKAGSAVLRTSQQVGLYTLIDILRGSRRADIARQGYDHLPTFGVGRDLSQDEWAEYIAQMVQLGILEIAYDDSNHLRLTPYGTDIVYGKTSVMLARYQAQLSRKAAKEKPQISTDPVQQLFEQLKAVRRQVADAAGVPAYVVFSDASLLDMARRRPRTPEEFMEVSGVGERKAVRYGKRFITAIRKFEGLTATMPKGYSHKETLILHNAGISPGEIAQIKGITFETVMGHIARLVDEDLIVDFGRYLSAERFSKIRPHIEQETIDYETLKQHYEPWEIALARSILAYHHRHGR